MQQKIEFINEYRSKRYTVSSLCEQFGISRSVAYKYIRRYEENGFEGLEELSRKPHHIPHRVSPEIEKAICQERKRHVRWGADKLLTLLKDRFPHQSLPAISTGNLILKRNGLITPRKRFRKIVPVNPIFDPKTCNEVWSADFKGKFRMGNNEYCHPLTIADSFSRYVFTAKGMYQPTYEGARAGFEEAFREFGLPQQIHTDNGAPFGSAMAICRLTRLAVWFIELGIEPVYSDPGRPDQNGRHERMHRELKGEATRPPGYNLNAQQRKLNSFVKEYNEIRPHSALNSKTPSDVHDFSRTPFPEKILHWDYDSDMRACYVSRNGAIRWGSYNWIGVTTTLSEKYVGLREIGEGIWSVYFRNKFLGYFDEKVGRIQDNEGRFKRDKV